MQYKEIDNETVELKFFGEIGYWYQNANDFKNTFSELERKYKKIIILVHCYGGNVFEGNVIANTINMSNAHITYRIVGVSASMSAFIQPHCDVVEICENSFVMIHEPSGSCWGKARDFFAYGNLLKSMIANFKKVLKLKPQSKKIEVDQWFDGADHWLNAEEAKAAGLVDVIIPAVVKDISNLTKPESQEAEKEVYLKFAATLNDGLPLNLDTNKIDLQMKKLLIDTFGLTSVTAESSDTAIAEAIKAKYASQETENKNLVAKVKTLEGSTIDSLIAGAEKIAGKEFTADQKLKLKEVGEKSGVDALAVALSFTAPAPAAAVTEETAAPGAPSAISLISKEGKGGAVAAERASWDWGKWCDEDEPGLFALSRELRASIYKKTYKEEYPTEAK